MILKSILFALEPAYAAALALIVIQVGIGVLFKAAQIDGKYSFSTSASLTISELFKLLLSTVFYYKECLERRREEAGYYKLNDADDDEERPVSHEENEENPLSPFPNTPTGYIGRLKFISAWPGIGTFSQAVRDEIPVETRYGFAQLALFYVLINNTTFLLFKLSDPGTIHLIKSGTTIITAVVSVLLLGTTIVRSQWLAIVLQVCGIVVTQYRSSTGTAYPLSTYLILLFQTTFGAVASVYNQKLCKSVDGSLNVMNMILYASGACINFILHLTVRLVNPDEPAFFTGYGAWGAIMVIISNIFIGLAMTAVYKYADAIIKCFSTSISTVILLYISPILFGVEFSFLILPGTTVVLLATWLYVEANPTTTSTTTVKLPKPSSRAMSVLGKLIPTLSAKGHLRAIGLGAGTLISVLIISGLQFWESRTLALSVEEPNSFVLESPFKNTLAYVRWNSKHQERIHLISEGYTSFFHTIHYSMPFLDNSTAEADRFVNLTHDSWDNGWFGYTAVKNTMQVILDEKDRTNLAIDGMFFFHFDAWLDPMAFADMDFDNIWLLDGTQPKFVCMKNTSQYDWWGWRKGFHEKAMDAAKLVTQKAPKYNVDVTEWCVGWSDIYYVPHQYFKPWIELADLFLEHSVFHEVAIPTIMHILDRTYRRLPNRSVIELIGDCWGNCCATNPTKEDILWKRCGHRLDYTQKEITSVHYDRLKEEALQLGTIITEGMSPG